MNTYSMVLIRFLQKHGLTVGNKIKNKASFPEWIFKNRKFASAGLRGLFDTDGGIYEKQKGYSRAVIEFQTKSPYINRDIIRLIDILGFKSSKGDSLLNIRIQNQEDIHKFFRIVGSSNIKNIIRYREFMRTGTVPRRLEVIKLMKNFNVNLPFKAA